MIMACSDAKKDTHFQWNSEVDVVWGVPTSPDSDEENVSNILRATDLVRSKTLTLESMHTEPFSLLSMKTMSAIRDDSYDCGVYDFSSVARTDLHLVCANELIRYKKTCLAYGNPVHSSHLREIVLLSLFSPQETIRAIIEDIFDTTATEANTVSFNWDALTACGKALSYQTNEGTTLLSSAICDCLVSKATKERNEETVRTERLIGLINKTLNGSSEDLPQSFSLESCIKNVIKPLIKNHCTRTAAYAFIAILEFVQNQPSSSLSTSAMETASVLVGDLCRSMSFEHRLPENPPADDSLTDNLDEDVRCFEKIAQCLPKELLGSAMRDSSDDLTWFIAYRLIPYILPVVEQEKLMRQEYGFTFQGIQACKGRTCIKSHEQMVILCATAPSHFIKFEEVCDGNLLDASEHETGKWLAALTRQQCLLTSSELYQLLTGSLGRVLWAMLPGRVCAFPKSHSCSMECAYIFALQLALRTVELILRSGNVAEVHSQQNNAALRVCRAVRRASEHFLQFEAENKLSFINHVACIQVLLQFSTGLFGNEAVKGKYYDSCVDIITMAVLENVKCLLTNYRTFGRVGDIKSLTDCIETFNNDFGASSKVCSAVLQVLRS